MKLNLPIIIISSMIIGFILWLCMIDLVLRYSWFTERETYIYEQFKDLDIKCNQK